MHVFGVRLLGLNEVTGHKLLLTIGLLLVAAAVAFVLRSLIGRPPSALHPVGRAERVRFWLRQAANLAVALVVVIALASIWFDDPANLAAAAGLLTAGLAFALQKVVTALAGYFVILRGKTFTVGDRIVMGGVRGDVVALGFFQTTILEMGQPPPEQSAEPAMWVESRQFTGRVVTVTNSRVFEEPIYNYTRDFPFIWEEMHLPIAYGDDRTRAERILLDAARQHAVQPDSIEQGMLARLKARYGIDRDDFAPRVYWRLTDNWVELTVRFLAHDHGVRAMKDRMARDVIAALDAAGIGIGSTTFAITGLPTVRIARERPAA
jgi:small-conductance mechanosensitive channel